MSDDSAPGIRNQAALSFAGTIVDATISFAGIVLFARVLGADGIGLFYSALAVVQVALFPVRGVGQAIQKRGSEQDKRPEKFLGAGLALGAGYLGIVTAAVLALVLGVGFTGQFTLLEVAAAVAVFGTRIGFLLVNDAYKGQGKTGRATLADNALGIAETATQVMFLLAGLEVAGLLLGTALSTAAATVGHLTVTSVGVARPSRSTARSLLSFARWAVPTTGLSTVYDRLPVLALYAVTSPTVVGYYTAANRLLMPGSFVGGSLGPALMVRASHRSSGTDEDVMEDLDATLRYAGVVAIPMFFGALAMPEVLMVTVFGPEFAAGAVALVGLGAYHVINSADTTTYSFVDGVDRPDFTLKATATGLVVRATLVAALIWPFGLAGVVAAVVVSHGVHLFLSQVLFVRTFDRPAVPSGVVYQIVGAVVMYVVVVVAVERVAVASWVPVGLVVGLGAACYAVVLITIDTRLREIARGILAETVGALRTL